MGKPPPRSLFVIPGWFPDTEDPNREWYWDGSDYTEERKKPRPEAPAKVKSARKMPRIYWSRISIGTVLLTLVASFLAFSVIPIILLGDKIDGNTGMSVLTTLTLVGWGVFFVLAIMVSPDEIKCAKCGTRFKSGYTTCRKCGHTYAKR